VHRLFYESLVHLGVLGLGHKEAMRFSPYDHRYEELDPVEKLYRKVG
jgi:chemotaxis protein methyltransferase CheR